MSLNRKLVILIMFVFGSPCYCLKADQPSSKVLEVAQAYANCYYGGEIDNGVPYSGPGKGDIVWVFTVYKKYGEIPSKENIQAMVAQARTRRLVAQNDLEYAKQTNNKENI